MEGYGTFRRRALAKGNTPHRISQSSAFRIQGIQGVRATTMAHLRGLKGSSHQLCQLPLTVNIFYKFPKLVDTMWLSPHNGLVKPKIYRSKYTGREVRNPTNIDNLKQIRESPTAWVSCCQKMKRSVSFLPPPHLRFLPVPRGSSSPATCHSKCGRAASCSLSPTHCVLRRPGQILSHLHPHVHIWRRDSWDSAGNLFETVTLGVPRPHAASGGLRQTMCNISTDSSREVAHPHRLPSCCD